MSYHLRQQITIYCITFFQPVAMYATVVDFKLCRKSFLCGLNDICYRIIHILKLYMKVEKQFRILDQWPFLFLCNIHEGNIHLLNTTVNTEQVVESINFPDATFFRRPLSLLYKTVWLILSDIFQVHGAWFLSGQARQDSVNLP